MTKPIHLTLDEATFLLEEIRKCPLSNTDYPICLRLCDKLADLIKDWQVQDPDNTSTSRSAGA